MQTDLINKNTDLNFGADGSLNLSMSDLQTSILSPPINKGTPVVNIDTSEYDVLSCQDLSNKFGIIAGQSFGTANEKARSSWIKRGCNTKPSSAASEESKPTNDNVDTEEESTDDDVFRIADEGGDNKILGMPKGVVIGLGISIALIGGFLVYKKFIAKK